LSSLEPVAPPPNTPLARPFAAAAEETPLQTVFRPCVTLRRANMTPLAGLAAYLTVAWLCNPVAAQPVAESLGPTASRYFQSRESAESAPPSWVLGGRRFNPDPAPTTTLVPTFAEVEGKQTATITVDPGTSLYGLPGTPGSMLRNGRPSGTEPAPCPWIFAVRADGTSWGALADTSAPCWVDLAGPVVFSTKAATLPLIILEAPSPTELLTTLNQLTGRAELPPLWAMGYSQQVSGTEASARAAATWLREHKIPADSLELVTPGPPLGIDAKAIPDLPQLLTDLRAKGFRLTARVGPLVPNTPDSDLVKTGTRDGVWLKTNDTEPMKVDAHGEPWLFPDFTSEAGHRWWSLRTRVFLDKGIDGLVLALAPKLDPAKQPRVAGDDLLGGPGEYGDVAASMDAFIARATMEGFAAAERNKRPVVSSPAFVVGMQRFAATAPDKVGAEHLMPREMMRSGLSLALSGQPLVAATIPAPDAAGDDLGRLAGLAAMFPMVRGELWPTPDGPGGDPAMSETLRKALERRARLIPYSYTLAFSTFYEFQPLLRPLFFVAPTDPSLRGVESAFLVGPDLLVVPRLAADTPKALPLLKGAWRKVEWGDGNPEDLPDVFLRPGAILPLGPVRQHADDGPLDPLTLLINLDETGIANGVLYEDSGEEYEFVNAQIRRTRYRAQRDGDAIFVRLSGLDGGRGLERRKVLVRILTDDGEITGEGSERGTIRIMLAPAP